MKLAAARIVRGKREVELTFRSPRGDVLTRRLGPRGLLSVLEAVRVAKVSRMRIYRMLERGELSRLRKGRVTMVRVGEVLKLVA